MIKVYGYEKDSEKLLELIEVTIQCDVTELEKMIAFLKEAKNQHSKVEDRNEICHSHYRDWNSKWDKNSADIIVVTPLVNEGRD